MNSSFILGLYWILFIVCLVLSLYFIYQLFQNSIYEPYLSKEMEYEYEYEDVSGSINSMVTDISDLVYDISGDLDKISDSIDTSTKKAPWVT